MIRNRLWNWIKVRYYRLIGAEICFMYTPTKEVLKDITNYEVLKIKNAPPGAMQNYTQEDLRHNNFLKIQKVGPIGMWVPYRIKSTKRLAEAQAEINEKADKFPVKTNIKEAYREKLRETIKEAIKSNTTIH